MLPYELKAYYNGISPLKPPHYFAFALSDIEIIKTTRTFYG
jgi:hypothetical protein